MSLGTLDLMLTGGHALVGVTKSRNHFPFTTIIFSAEKKKGEKTTTTVRAAGSGVLNLNGAQASAILEVLSRTNCRVTIPRIVIWKLHGGGRARMMCGPGVSGEKTRTTKRCDYPRAAKCLVIDMMTWRDMVSLPPIAPPPPPAAAPPN